MKTASPSRIHEIAGFLSRYRDYRHSQTGDLNSRVKTFLSYIQKVTAARLAIEAREAPEFNVIKVLRLDRDECAHSRIIASLLNPRGSHGQQGLFLFSFLDRFVGNYERPAADDEVVSTIRVLPEKPTWFGRIDIVVRLPKSLCIVIENKVDACEGKDQLFRYSKWLTLQPEPCKVLFFLTPSGRCSDQNVTATCYRRIAYINIADWLDGCLPFTEPTSVRLFLKQYINVVREIGTMQEDPFDAEPE